jgi:outer membrane receptor protein involved in Fe transport
MNSNAKLSYAIAVILGTNAAGIARAASDTDTSGTSDMLQEITVTAQRRAENMQDVPISMQAFTAETLQQLNIATFDDYIKDLPNVTSQNNGPGQSEVFMRGLSAGAQFSQGSASTGLWPNVAIYLDNQSAQLPNRNLDIYAADLNRIEVLEGPQGTLFGAGAEAGVIRYITNEPKLDVTELNIKGGGGTTAHGDGNYDVTAVLNLPLIGNTLAVRAVVYDDRRGGYIDNVPATFTRRNTDLSTFFTGLPADAGGACPDGKPNAGYCVPPGSPVINNNNIAARAINAVTYQGFRVEALYKINDDWDVLLSQSYQDMDSHGVFYQQPNASDGAPLQRLQVTLFNDSFDKDRFESTALTVTGKIGDLKAVYTGGYLVRNVDQIGDYTNYARGVYADYYQCQHPQYDATLMPACYSPSSIWHSTERNTHQQHEIRLSTPDDWRLRAIGGAFYENNVLYDQTAWQYKTVPSCTATLTAGCFANVGTFPGTTVQNPGVQNGSTSFYQDTIRQTKQIAFFASVDYDIIPRVLTITAGTRHFLFQNLSAGSVLSSFLCYEAAVTPDGCHAADSYNLNAQNLRDTESGWKSRGNLTWHITSDVMVYYTFSQGFRPGGFNQNGGSAHALDPTGVTQYVIPKSYSSDKLTNNEIGWKTEFFDHHLQWNGAIYQENWDNVQISFFQSGLLGNIFYDANGQDFRIRGIETSLIARPFSGLTLQGAASWNSSTQTNAPQLLINNPANANFGQPITQTCGQTVLVACTSATNPFGTQGSPSANAPPIQFSLRARYQWTINGYTPFVQFGATHQGHSFTQAGSNPTVAQAGLSTSRLRFENPAYSTYDASIGIAKDAWYVTMFGENLANSNASTFISDAQFIVAQTPLRPRVIGVTVGYKFY